MKLIDPSKLTREELVQLVLQVQGVLHPSDNPDHEWSGDDLETIDRLLHEEV